MVMDIQEISDRLEIDNLLIDYCTAVDAQDFAADTSKLWLQLEFVY